MKLKVYLTYNEILMIMGVWGYNLTNKELVIYYTTPALTDKIMHIKREHIGTAKLDGKWICGVEGD